MRCDAQVVASCAQAMGMHVIGYDPVMTPDAFQEVSYSPSLSLLCHNAVTVIEFSSEIAFILDFQVGILMKEDKWTD